MIDGNGLETIRERCRSLVFPSVPRPERTFSDKLQERATIFVVERNSFRFARSCILSRSSQKCDRRGANGMNSVLRPRTHPRTLLIPGFSKRSEAGEGVFG